jgi:hypothetical protein
VLVVWLQSCCFIRGASSRTAQVTPARNRMTGLSSMADSLSPTTANQGTQLFSME